MVERPEFAPQVRKLHKRLTPIKELFSPTDKVQILFSVPSERRMGAVRRFKQKLARQREAWTICRNTIESRIETNPNISREQILDTIKEFSESYGFSEDQINIATQLVEDYILARKRTLAVRQKYPDNLALIKHLTGIRFKSEDRESFHISSGPMSIDIKTNRLNFEKIHRKISKREFSNQLSGFASIPIGNKPLYFTVVVNENVDTRRLAKTIDHEHQHVKNDLFENRIGNPRKSSRNPISIDLGILRISLFPDTEKVFMNNFPQKYKSERNFESKQNLLNKYFLLKRTEAFNLAKDEIFACLRDPARYDSYIYGLFLPGSSPPYDYLSHLRNSYNEDKLWQRHSQKILFAGYTKIIAGAIEAAFKLKVKGGYSSEEVIGLLTDKPLTDWHKSVKRQIEGMVKKVKKPKKEPIKFPKSRRRKPL